MHTCVCWDTHAYTYTYVILNKYTIAILLYDWISLWMPANHTLDALRKFAISVKFWRIQVALICLTQIEFHTKRYFTPTRYYVHTYLCDKYCFVFICILVSMSLLCYLCLCFSKHRPIWMLCFFLGNSHSPRIDLELHAHLSIHNHDTRPSPQAPTDAMLPSIQLISRRFY